MKNGITYGISWYFCSDQSGIRDVSRDDKRARLCARSFKSVSVSVPCRVRESEPLNIDVCGRPASDLWTMTRELHRDHQHGGPARTLEKFHATPMNVANYPSTHTPRPDRFSRGLTRASRSITNERVNRSRVSRRSLIETIVLRPASISSVAIRFQLDGRSGVPLWLQQEFHLFSPPELLLASAFKI